MAENNIRTDTSTGGGKNGPSLEHPKIAITFHADYGMHEVEVDVGTGTFYRVTDKNLSAAMAKVNQWLEEKRTAETEGRAPA
jgi:hypothetical protein